MSDHGFDELESSATLAASRGGPSAHRDFVHACIPLIRQIARAQGHAGIAIDDLVQDVLLSLQRTWVGFDRNKPFRPWLSTIVRRRAIDQIRRARLHRSHLDLEAFADTLAAPMPEICTVDQARRVRLLHEAIDALPPRQREAMIHVGLGEASLAEAADRVGVKRTALRVSYHRALKALRTKLDPELAHD